MGIIMYLIRLLKGSHEESWNHCLLGEVFYLSNTLFLATCRVSDDLVVSEIRGGLLVILVSPPHCMVLGP